MLAIIKQPSESMGAEIQCCKLGCFMNTLTKKPLQGRQITCTIHLLSHKNEVKNLEKYFVYNYSKEKFDLILIFSKLQNLNKIKKYIKNNAKIIDFNGSNKKTILSKNLSYISLENE